VIEVRDGPENKGTMPGQCNKPKFRGVGWGIIVIDL